MDFDAKLFLSFIVILACDRPSLGQSPRLVCFEDFFWSFLFLTMSLARIIITCNQHHIFVDGALDSLAERCLPWNKRPSPLVRIALFFFSFLPLALIPGRWAFALRLRNISTKVASVKNDAWSMFHSLRCIMGASPVNYVPATSLKPRKQTLLTLQKNVTTMFFKTLNP